MNTNKKATGSSSKRLLAALAVLAVAFVVLAAVPAVATDSDAAPTSTTSTQVYVSSSGSDTTGQGTSAAPYATIGEALQNVSDGGVISLSSDIEIKAQVNVTKSVTIDLGAHTITINHADSNTGRIVIDPSSSSNSIIVAIQNGSINFISDDGGSSPVKIVGSDTHAPTMTLDRLSITSDDYGVSVWGTVAAKTTDATTPTLNAIIKNSVITATGDAAAVGTNGMYGGEKITITGSTLTSAEGAAVFAPSNSMLLKIENSTLTGVSGIDVRAGNVEVVTSTINYNGPAEEKTGGDGPVAFGVGISVLPNTNYGSTTTGANVTVDKDTVFNGGANAEDEVIVGGFTYPGSTDSVTYADIISSTAAIPKKADVTIGGVEVEYASGSTGVATINDGAVSASSGAVVTISDSITVTDNSSIYGSIVFSGSGKITVAPGAVLRLGDNVTVTSATGTGAVAKPIINNGTVVIVKTNLSIDTIKSLIDGKAANVKDGYTITYPDTDISCIGLGISYYGEKVTFTAVLSDDMIAGGYKVGRFTATSTETSVTAPKITGADGTYSFTMVKSNLTITHAPDDAWTASFYLVFNDGADTVLYTAVKGNSSDTSITVADPSVTGYVFYGWYDNSSLTGDAEDSFSLASGPVTYYADMQRLYTVVIKEFVDGKESSVGGIVSTTSSATVDSSATFSVTEKNVRLYIAPGTGYKLGSVTVGGVAATVAGAASPYTVDVALGTASVEVDVYFLKTYVITYDSLVLNGAFSGIDSAAAGEEVVVTGTGSTATIGVTYGVASVKLVYTVGTGSSATTVTDVYPMAAGQKSTLWTANADGTYTFIMPAYAVEVSGTFAPVYSITLEDGTSTGSYKLSSSAEAAAEGVQITITVTNGKSFAAKGLTVAYNTSQTLTVGNGITDNKDSTYTFMMPAAAVTVSATEAQLFDVKFTVVGAAVENVKIDGISTEVVSGKVSAYHGQKIAFDAVAAEGYTIKTIAGTSFDQTSTNAPGTYSFNMSSVAVEVKITGEIVVYYKLVIDNSDVAAYSDADMKNTVDLDMVPSSSTVYLTVTGTTATKIITSVTVSYTEVDASSLTATEIYQTIGATKYAEGVYIFTMPGANVDVKNDTVNASVALGTPTSTVTIENPDVGSIAVVDSDGKAVRSGDKVAYGTVLTVAVTLVDGKVVSEIAPEMERISIADNVFTYTLTMGIGDITIDATVADGYVISVVYDESAVKTLTVPDYAAVGAPVTLSIELNTDYSFVATNPVTAVYGSSASTVAVTGSAGSYTFTMPAGAVVVSIDTDPKTITVDAVDGADVKVAASDDDDADAITSAASGATIFVTVAPKDGYKVNGIIVTDASGNAVRATAGTTVNTWTFVMPSSAATVKADVESTTTLKGSEAMIPGLYFVNNTVSVTILPTDGGFVPSGEISLTIGYRLADGSFDFIEVDPVSYTAKTDSTAGAVVTFTVAGSDLATLASATGVTITASFDSGLDKVPTSSTISAVFTEASA